MPDPLQEHVERVAKNSNLTSYNEDQTKQSIILPVLQHLGWSIFEVDDVYPEFSAGSGRVDYALRIAGTNKVFIEVKRCDVDLEKHQEQLLRYSFEHGVPQAVLTNGIVWWFYLPLREGVWEQRRFYTLDLNQRSPDDVSKRLMDFLSWFCVESGESIKHAETVITSRRRQKEVEKTLPRAWDDLLSGPDDALVELLREKVEQLCGFTPTDTEVHHYLHEVANGRGKRIDLSKVNSRPEPSERTRTTPFRNAGTTESPMREVPSRGKQEVPTSFTLDELLRQDLHRTKPTRLLIDGQELKARSWSKASVGLVRWALGRGILHPGNLPVYSYSRKKRYFVNTEDSHKDEKLGGSWKEVEGVFVDTNFSSKDHVKNMKSLLEQVGRTDVDVRVILRS